jgi:uncharacterized protein YukE
MDEAPPHRLRWGEGKRGAERNAAGSADAAAVRCISRGRRIAGLRWRARAVICFIHASRTARLPPSLSLSPSLIMAQAIMDPEEVRRFAKELKRFNDEVQIKAQGLQARFAALGSTWQDQEAEKFAEEFLTTMKVMKKFVEISEKHTPYLLRKAQRIEEYLNQR